MFIDMESIMSKDRNNIYESNKFEDENASGKKSEKLKKLKPPVHQLNLDYSHESLYATNGSDFDLKKDDLVLVPTRYGLDAARFSGEVKSPVHIHPDSIVEISKKVTEDELHRIKENDERAKEAAKIFKEKVADNKLDMKFITCHFLFGEAKVLFFFSSDNRVDFRQLVKDLVSVFKMRVELRQIGVRDEPRILGGLGFCGRALCCSSISDKLKPVSIKMAKEQNVSINSTKISGECGRLLCCLAYEHACYVEGKKSLPSVGVVVNYDDTNFKITSVNPLTKIVSLYGADGRVLSMPSTRFVKKMGRWQIN